MHTLALVMTTRANDVPAAEQDADQRPKKGIGAGVVIGAVGWICLVVGVAILI
jgi:hypothetical protein